MTYVLCYYSLKYVLHGTTYVFHGTAYVFHGATYMFHGTTYVFRYYGIEHVLRYKACKMRSDIITQDMFSDIAYRLRYIILNHMNKFYIYLDKILLT
jgi:hypothetical protein